jgi:hypothetical protein
MAVKTKVIILILLTCVLSGFAAEEGFKRYQIIIDKHPFGEEPAEAVVVQIPFNQSFARNLRLTMLFEGPDGDVRAGIIDSAKKKNYILNIGGIEDDLELIEVNLADSTATLRKGKEMAQFSLKEDPKMVAGKPKPTRKLSSYSERMKQQRAAAAARKKAAPARPALTGKALREHLIGVQMDAIRTGKPPLPIPLTPEMDAQLVNEGVLDPQ